MIAQGRWHTTSYALSLKDSSLNVAINGDYILVCDLAGRLYSVYRAGLHHRRSLNGSIIQKWSTGERQRRWLEPAEADELIAETADCFRELRAALSSPDWEWVTPPDSSTALDQFLMVIDRAAHFDSNTAQSDAAWFERVYAPIGILPPDQYLALVLQATVGCSFNTCTFCDLYHQPFRIKTPDQFRRHIWQVRDYLDASLALRQRSIFLGAANALAIPMPRLLSIFDIIQEEFSPLVGVAVGVYAFLDAFTGTRKSVEDYRALAERGLKRVYIGLESGHDPLLEFVRKPGHARDAIETVQAIKSAGINVGVIALIGLGGEQFAAGHTADTSAVLKRMALDQGDLLYFSDLVEEPGTPYPQLAEQHGIRPLDQAARLAQRAEIRSGILPGGVKISNYDVREFVY